MKKNVTKVILLVLSLALLVGSVIGISVSASDSAPVIISKNVKTTGNFCLMFAIDPATVAGDDVTVTVYNQDPTGLEGEALAAATVQTITKAKSDVQYEALDGDGVKDDAVLVIETAGVAAKDIADVWYITTASAGNVSDVMTYSVREYAFERLYKDGTVTATEEDGKRYYQKQFYLELLDMGSAAQELQVNFGNENPERLAKEYTYVAVNNGTYTLGNVTAAKGFVEIGDVLALTANDASVTGWNVFTYGQNGGEISTQIVANGDTITIAGNTVVVPYTAGVTPGLYFAEIGDQNYNFTKKDWKFIQPANGYMAHTKLTGASEAETNRNYAMYSFGASGDEKYGDVFSLAHQKNDYNFAMLAHFPVQEKDENANVLVFEFDMKFIDGFGCYADEETARNAYSAIIFSWNGADLTTVASNTTSTAATQALLKQNMMLIDADGQFEENTFEVSSGTNTTYKTGGDTLRFEGAKTGDIAKGEWHNICYEVYTDVNKVIYYLDGVAVHTATFGATIDISAVQTNSIQFEPRFRDASFMLDNVFCGKIAKEYVAP